MNNKKLMEIWKRVSNWKSMMAIASAILILTNVFGLKVDNEKFMTAIEAILTVLVVLGIINKEGMESHKWND